MATRRLVLLVSLIVAMTAACAGTGASPPLTMTATTLMYRWEHHFTLEWTAGQGQNSSRRVTGYVYNWHGEYAQDLRVLAQALARRRRDRSAHRVCARRRGRIRARLLRGPESAGGQLVSSQRLGLHLGPRHRQQALMVRHGSRLTRNTPGGDRGCRQSFDVFAEHYDDATVIR